MLFISTPEWSKLIPYDLVGVEWYLPLDWSGSKLECRTRNSLRLEHLLRPLD